MNTCDFLFPFRGNHGLILFRFPDIARYLAENCEFFSEPTFIYRPNEVPLELCSGAWV